MDPSIIKMLEEDEDESMHSGADVEAFSAALGRDMKGETSTSQTHASKTVVSEGSNPSSTQMFSQWQPSQENESSNSEGQQDIKSLQQKEQHSSEIELKHHDSCTENQLHVTDNTSQELSSLPLQQSQMQQQQQPAEQNPVRFSQTTGMQISDQNLIQAREPNALPNSGSDSQISKLQNVTSQPLLSKEQANNPVNRGKQVPFAMLLPVIVPQLDKDRAMQLQTLYAKLKRNEIPKEGFVRHMRSIVGDHMLKMAVVKLQQGTTKSLASVNSQTGGNQFQSQASAQHHHQKMASQFSDAHSFGQLHQKGNSSPADTSTVSTSAAQLRVDSTYPNTESSAQKSREMERQSDSRGMPVSQMPSSSVSAIKQEPQSTMPVHGLNKQQQQMHFSQTSFPMYGSAGSSYNPYSSASVNTPAASLRPLNHDSQVRQVPPPQGISSAQMGAASQAMNVMNMPKFERQSPITDPQRVPGGPIPNMLNSSSVQQNSASWQSHLAKGQKINYVKQEPLDQSNEQQMKSQLPAGQASFSSANIEQGNAISGGSKDDALEKNTSRMGFSTPMGLMSANSVSTSATTALDGNAQLGSRLPSTTSPVTAGTTIRTPPKRPSIGQKKPLDPPGSSPPGSIKKQKVSGAFLDQSIDQLNDVTAVSGVNLREEEEQLFSGPKEDCRISEASRRVVQEEEERLILQKAPLQKKLAEIMAKCGLKNISNDVERCLSLCVEERMHGLISNLIRLSKQLDIEKQRHQAIITSDVRHQILTMNRKAREELGKKQAEQEKLRKENEPESSAGADGDKEKDDGRAKPTKSNKEEDDKMRTTAANVAARAAVGGDDMLSKWQLMAEQARQKREGGTDAASGSQPGKNGTRKPLSTAGRNAKDSLEAEKRAHSAVGISVARKLVRHPAIPQTGPPHSISVKDVIAALEREPQMSKSTLIYRLYEKISANAANE